MLKTRIGNITQIYILRLLNNKDERLAQAASSFGIPKDSSYNWIKIERFLPPLQERLVKQGLQIMELNEINTIEDWRTPIMQYLNNPSITIPTKKKNMS